MLESKACKRYDVQPSRSKLTFEAKSTLHAVRGAVEQLAGYIEGAFDEAERLVLEPVPKMHVEFPVESLRTGNGMQDREMWRLIDSRRFPSVLADLRSIRAESNGRYAAEGDVTLAGRTRRYSGELTIETAPETVTVAGDLSIDIRDFGLRPPNLIVVKVEPVVTVRLHLVAST